MLALLLGAAVVAPCAGTSAEERRDAASQGPVLVAQTATARGQLGFSSDGRHVLVCGAGEITLWEKATGNEIRRIQYGEGDVFALSSFPARYLLTGNYGDSLARLVDAQTGKEVRRFVGHQKTVRAGDLSRDGRLAVTRSDDRTVALWDATNGKRLHHWTSDEWIQVLRFAPDSRHVLIGSSKHVRLWDSATKQERWVRNAQGLSGVSFSPDGRHVLLGSYYEPAQLCETATGKAVRRYEDSEGPALLSPDGRHVLIGRHVESLLFDTASGEIVRRFPVQPDPNRRTRELDPYRAWALAFSPDGREVLTGHQDRAARLWRTASGEELGRFEARALYITSIAFSPDGKQLVIGSRDTTARIWDMAAGQQSHRLDAHDNAVWRVAYSRDSRWVLTGGLDMFVVVWDAASGKALSRVGLPTSNALDFVAFTPDGDRVLTVNGAAQLCDRKTGELIRRFETSIRASSAAVSPDGRLLLLAGGDGKAQLFETDTGKAGASLQGHTHVVFSAAFSPDGRRAVTGSRDKTVRLWDTATGNELLRLEGHADWVNSVQFAPDGRHLLTADNTEARIWDVGTGALVRRLPGALHVARFTPDGRHIVSGSPDGTARLWDAANGNLLCSIVSFRDGTWAVVDAERRYDASNGGAVRGLHWVVGDESISLEQLKDRFYDPGLLAKYLGHNDEPLRNVEAFDAVALFPSVEVRAPTADDARVQIALTNRGGGIGKVVVLVNGKEVTADARRAAAPPDAPSADVAVDLSNDPRVLPGEENTVQVLAYNAEGNLRSRGLDFTWKAPGQKTGDQSLWAIVCGVSDYRGNKIDLKYAAKDAEAFAKALNSSARALLDDRVHMTVLSTSGNAGTKAATRANLVAALEAAQAAKPHDVLVIYLAGHGVNGSGESADFYYLLSTAMSAQVSAAVRKQDMLSSTELFEFIQKIPAAKRQVMILDTCASGRLIDQLTESRSVPGSQVRALQRLKDRTGVFVLAGCAADTVSYEAGRFGQGLLTYAVLHGMQGAALRDEFVDVSKLFNHAADEVPRLAKDIGGVQRPIVAMPKGGGSFDIGLMTSEARAAIDLQKAKPVFVRSSFHHKTRFRDELQLEAAVDAALRDMSANAGVNGIVFVDARRMPDAYEVTGAYTVQGDIVTAEVIVWLGEVQVARFERTGNRRDLAKLAGQVAAASREHAR